VLETKGALFSMVAVIGRDKLNVSAMRTSSDVDEKAPIQRYACSGCGVHMYGRIENKNHPFYGFVFCTLCRRTAAVGSEFAALRLLDHRVGLSPARMGEVRARLKELRLEPMTAVARFMDHDR